MSLSNNLNFYAVTVASVHDGDTVRLNFDLGFGVALNDKLVDLAGVDAPELRKSTMRAAEQARDALKEKLTAPAIIAQLANPLTNERPSVVLHVSEIDGWVNVNEWMITNGFAKNAKG